MNYARDLILTLTILAIIYTADNWPKPVKDNQVAYCLLTYKAARKDIFGQWETGWAKGYGPCKDLDRYENI